MSATTTTTKPAAQKITKGLRFRGLYMGAPFTGVVTRIESDASGYVGTLNDVRIYVQIDADIIAPEVIDLDGTVIPSFKRRSVGDCVIMLGTNEKGLITRTDDKFSNLFIVR